jgi:type IV secretion system protein TrbL
MSAQNVAGIYPMIDLNPLDWLGDKAKETLADGFTSMMMGLWSAGMWLLKTAFGLIDGFTPSVSDPDLSKLYSVTLWISLVIAVVVAFGQIGLAVLRQDGRGFGNLAAGVVQYGVVVGCWVGVCAGIITGASGLTKGILDTLLGVDSFSGYSAGDGFVDTVSGTVQAATLGVVALFVVIPAAFGHIIIMLVRSAALLILTAIMPIAAAGSLSEGSKSWMWKSIRWFLACALMEPLLALVLGLGTQFAWAGMPDGAAAGGSSSAQNIGTSVVGSVILLVACFTPLVLFRLLAFVDPGTASGASFRSTMNANGGVAGLVKGKGAHGAAASETASDGRTSSENGAEAQTANRFQSSTLGKVGGKVGGFVGGAVEKTGKVAQAGASMSVDVLGQSGIGNQGYYDTSYSPRGGRPHRQRLGNPQAFEKSGNNDSDEGNKGVANDIPPQAQTAVEEGAFLA